MTELRTIPVILLGVGNIGSTLLRQILSRGDAVARRTGLQLATVGLADVSGLLFDPDGLPGETLRVALELTAQGGLLESLPDPLRPLGEVTEALRPGAILADLTGSPKTGPTLHAALDAGCGLVLANKIPLAGPWEEAKPLLQHPHVRYECTVGAGLPVIDTLQHLLDTGDEVNRIEGCLSGTLGYLCAELEKGVPYSTAVAQANELGYTEPDPRDDLSGKDVARKALILARTVRLRTERPPSAEPAGWPLEESDLRVESLYSPWLAEMPVREFLANARAMDKEYASRVQKADDQNQVLRYVARVDAQGGTVGLIPVDRRGPLGALRGPANRVAFHTANYSATPLAISGPGAGREVTAAGVMSDMIKLARQMA